MFVTIVNNLVSLPALSGTLILCWLSWNYFEKCLIQLGHGNEYLR